VAAAAGAGVAAAGPAIGGLLNVSFGNTAELILALFVLAAGKRARALDDRPDAAGAVRLFDRRSAGEAA
jgi:Ca2+/H+ antiporter